MRENIIKKTFLEKGYREIKDNNARYSTYTALYGAVDGLRNAVIIIDNFFDVVYKYKNVKCFREDISTLTKVPKDNILVIVMDDKLKRAWEYFGKNLIVVNHYTGAYKKIAVSFHLRKVAKIAADGIKLHKTVRKVASTWTYHSFDDRHSTFIVWLMVAFNAFIAYKTLGDYESWGISVNTAYLGGETFRFFTYMFAHGNLAHIVANMASLLVVGNMYTRTNGYVKFLTTYFGGGFYAGIFTVAISALLTGDVVSLTMGASGAIYAILGALFAEAILSRGVIFSIGQIAKCIFLSMLLACFVPNVSHACHIGGLIGGFFIQSIFDILNDISYENIFIKGAPSLKKHDIPMRKYDRT